MMSAAINQRIRRITPGQLLVVAAFVVILCVLVRRGGDPDIFWHLITGQWMVDHHQVVSKDLFTFTVSGTRWIDPEYTTEIIAYLVYKVGGLTLVSLAFGAVTFAGFLLIWRRVRLENANLVIASIVIGIAGLGGAEVWGPRPQMITFTLTCLEVLWLDRYLRGKSRAIYWLPLVMIAWANLHGGFLFGLVPVGVAAFVEAVHWIRGVDGDEHKRRTRNLILIFVGCVAAAVINPNGIHLYGYVIQPQFSSVQQNFIAEWQSPNFHVLEERGFELMLLLHSSGVHLPATIAVGRVPHTRRLIPCALGRAPFRALRRRGNPFAHMVVLGRMGAHGADRSRARRGSRRAHGRCSPAPPRSSWSPSSGPDTSCTARCPTRPAPRRRTSRSARRTGSRRTRTSGLACSTSTDGAAT